MDETGVYNIINIINNKPYIGSTTTSFNIRWDNHLNALRANNHANSKLQRSFNKHGESNFKFIIIERCSQNECIIREQYYLDTVLFAQEYIRKEDKRFTKLGFNISPTAGNTFGKPCKKSTRDKISKANKGKLSGDKHPMYGKTRAPTWTNKTHSDESKLKMSIFQKNRFRSKEEIDNLKNRIKSGSEHPLFGVKREWLGEFNKLTKTGIPSKNRRAVLKFDLNNNFIEKYSSLKEAAEKNNIKHCSKICSVCRNKRKSVGGFIWKYEELLLIDKKEEINV